MDLEKVGVWNAGCEAQRTEDNACSLGGKTDQGLEELKGDQQETPGESH